MATSRPPPPEDTILQVCDVTSLDRVQATILLQKWPDFGDAVTHYFEDPVSALREDAPTNQWIAQDNVPSFQIVADAGLSRPSSPTPNFIDMTEDHAQATAQVNNAQNKEDEDLNRAMAESMKGMAGQENGTTGNGQLNPAQRPYYSPADWALVPVASSREVVDHPPPAKRRRILGSPAFLRGSSETNYTAPLLTIYHSIPLAREALLFPPLKVFSYGHNPDWWSGSTDENSKPLSMEHSATGSEDRRKYLAELQCLMAFLDNTTRAYGSVDALSELRYCQYFRPESESTKFLEAWQQAAMQEADDEPLTQVFTTNAVSAAEYPGVVLESKDLFEIVGPIANTQTQAELLDEIVWADSAREPLADVWFERIGHILTMRIYSNGAATKLNLTPTETWYLDRYTPELRDNLRRLRQQCHALIREKALLKRAQLRLTELAPSGLSQNVRETLEAAKEALPVAMNQATRVDTKLVDDEIEIDAAKLQLQIDELLSRMDRQVHELNVRKGDLDSQIKAIMSDYTDPATSSQNLRYKYTLQGVTTKANITYVRTLNHDLIGLNEEEPFEQWQWWRTTWNDFPAEAVEGDINQMLNDTRYSVQKVTFLDVQEAVRTENNTAVLVYVNDTAMTFKRSPLSASLREFVEKDNRAFEDEISLNHVQDGGRGRSWSNETNSTIMDENDPFEDTTFPSHIRDTTPMSTSTIRSFDGPPSPKRSKSSDESRSEMGLMDLSPGYDNAAMVDNKTSSEKPGNRIGYFAEKLLQKADEREQEALNSTPP